MKIGGAKGGTKQAMCCLWLRRFSIQADATYLFFCHILRQLFKKYRSLANDVELLKKELLENPESGVDLGNNTRKVRMAIASKGKGKSSGARIITFTVFIDVANADIYLLTMYDKGEQDSVSDKEIDKLKRESRL